MKVYHLIRTYPPYYNEYGEHIIVCSSPERARELANHVAGDEGKIWQDESLVCCRELDISVEHIALSSFRAR